MKRLNAILFCLLVLVLLTGLLSWKGFKERPVYTEPVKFTSITMCSSFATDWSDTSVIQNRILPGLGDLQYKISTSNSQAQEFFNQGLRLIYAFNHWESIQSFRHAAKLDPDCAMVYWGLSLAYGPNINDINPKDRENLAYESIQKAISKMSKASAIEKEMILALSKRYDGNAYDDRSPLNIAYSEAMSALALKFPNDPEVQTLCADAIMNTMPWDYWLKTGEPKPETAKAKNILDNALKKFPKHPGANHLYIHLLEASPEPSTALASAKILETSMPGAGHIVHMPAHIYLRVGEYSKSIEANKKAVAADENYLANSENRGMYRWGYYPHNIDFISFSAYMEGRSELAISTAMKLAYKGNLISVSNPVFAQYFSVEPMIAFTRFGKWNDILSLQQPDDNFVYAQLIYRFAKGMASLRTDNLKDAKIQWSKLDSLCKLDTLKNIYFSFNPVSDIVQVPLHILSGEIQIREKKMELGVISLTKAVEAEDNLRYMEPPDWKIPSRQFLGAALLESNKYAEAATVFLDDLKRNPENVWSLYGLNQIEVAGKNSGAGEIAQRFKKASVNSDIKFSRSAF